MALWAHIQLLFYTSLPMRLQPTMQLTTAAGLKNFLAQSASKLRMLLKTY
jgi:hypothetical protein